MNISEILQVSSEALASLEDIAAPLLAWYQLNKREMPWRDHPDPYYIWVSEIMLQQTRVEAVRGYFSRFVEVYPTIEDLALSNEDQLLKLWEGLGYYNRARNLRLGAIYIVENFGGQLPPDYDDLKTIPGIGDYTAGAISSLAFGLNTPAIDGNVYRVISRVLASKANTQKSATVKAYAQLLSPLIPKDTPGDFNQALMELGALVCRPNGYPHCDRCPLSEICLGSGEDWVVSLPVKNKPNPRRNEQRTLIFLLTDKPNRIFLRRRPSKGLLANLWEPINEEEQYTKKQVEGYLKNLGIHSYTLKKMPNSKHIFSHIEWQMTSWQVLVEYFSSSQGEWITSLENHSLPSAFAAHRLWIADYLKENEQTTL